MNTVYLIGAGATPVAEHYSRTLYDLAVAALRATLADVNGGIAPEQIAALYVANAFGDSLGGQGNLGAALANAAGLTGCEAVRVDAAGASGGAALHLATQAVASGQRDLVLVLGAEKVTDRFDTHQASSAALALDSDFEQEHGITLTGAWAMLMRRYMHEYGYAADAFAPFPINAHANAKHNPQAMYRFSINADKYNRAAQVASPLNMLDCASLGDGAAAVLLASERFAQELRVPRVRVAGSALATDTLRLGERNDPLWLAAAERSAAQALQQAGIAHDAVQVFEVSDPHGIAAALTLEASGFVERGTAPRHAAEGEIALTGATPLATAGGYKARGDVGGASGVYQVVELMRQLRGQAGDAQVADAHTAFAQTVGGVGSTVVSLVLQHED